MSADPVVDDPIYWLGMGVLSLLLVVPTVGAAVVALLGRLRIGAKIPTLTFSVATLVAALAVRARFDFSSSGYQLVESYAWMPSLGVSYLLGVDTVSLLFVLMTAAITVFSVLASWGATRMGETAFFPVVLLLEAAILGAFLAIDVLLFYLFWLLALVALGLLIGLWGDGRRVRAALTFSVLTVGGSFLMLLVILICHHIHFVQSGSPSFDARHWVGLVLTPTMETWLFWGVFVAFAVQTPLFPFQFWLTGVARESLSVGHVLAGTVLLKIGAYGLVRFAVPWFPRAAWTYAPVVMALAVSSVLFGALAAVVSADARKFAARVTVAHMGVVLFGIFSFSTAGVKSAFILAISHGFFMSGLIMLGGMIEERTGGPLFEDQRGLGRLVPFGLAIAMLLSVGAVAIPTYCGFEIIRGATPRSPIQAAAVAFGFVLLTAAFGRVARNSLRRTRDGDRKELRGRELLLLMALVVLVIWVGIAPGSVLGPMDSIARDLVSHVDNHVVITE